MWYIYFFFFKKCLRCVAWVGGWEYLALFSFFYVYVILWLVNWTKVNHPWISYYNFEATSYQTNSLTRLWAVVIFTVFVEKLYCIRLNVSYYENVYLILNTLNAINTVKKKIFTLFVKFLARPLWPHRRNQKFCAFRLDLSLTNSLTHLWAVVRCTIFIKKLYCIRLNVSYYKNVYLILYTLNVINATDKKIYTLFIKFLARPLQKHWRSQKFHVLCLGLSWHLRSISNFWCTEVNI